MWSDGTYYVGSGHLDDLAASHLSGDLHGSQHGHDVVAQLRKAYLYQPDHGGTSRRDDGLRELLVADELAGQLGHQLGSSADLIYIVEADGSQTRQHIVDVVQVIELAEESWGGESDFYLEFFDILYGI